VTITSHAGAAPGATGSGAPAIRIKGVSKTFGRGSEFTVALKEVDLDVAEREFLCIVGASGCGKSTLLNLIAELDQPSTGTIETGGRKVAFMFQEATLFPWLTAGQNVDLALKLRGMPRPQRTQLARVLAQEAEIVLMDEPFAALDAMTRDSMHDEIERIKDELGLTIVFVTHNVREAVRLGDRTVLFFSSPGRVKTEYPIDLERPRRFDMPGLAELSGQLTDDLKAEVAQHVR
jgi:NitT/TauT family transport system ATP-binding protein